MLFANCDWWLVVFLVCCYLFICVWLCLVCYFVLITVLVLFFGFVLFTFVCYCLGILVVTTCLLHVYVGIVLRCCDGCELLKFCCLFGGVMTWVWEFWLVVTVYFTWVWVYAAFVALFWGMFDRFCLLIIWYVVLFCLVWFCLLNLVWVSVWFFTLCVSCLW